MKFRSIFFIGAMLLFVSAVRAETFTAYLSPAQEVPPSGTGASGYARVFVNEAAGTLSFTVVFNNLSSAQSAAHIHAPAAIGANAAAAINFGTVGGTSGTITGNANITPTLLAQLRAGQGYVNVHSVNFGGGEIRGQLARPRPVDNDGDGRTDLSILRFPASAPNPITFWNLNSTSGVQAAFWGQALTDFPAPGDYDGDGMGDIALYRDGTNPGDPSIYYIIRSSNGTAQVEPYGLSGDQTIARDFDGDGRTDPAIFRRGPLETSPTQFWIKQSSANYTDRVVTWGLTGNQNTTFDTPVVGDYDGDGKFDAAVYRVGMSPANTFIILRSSDGQVVYQPWGNFSTDFIVPGDYDGDGKTDFCATRTGATGSSPMVWWILQSSNGQVRVQSFGISTDLPAQGDYDGDGRTDLAIFRGGATTGAPSTFWMYQSLFNTALAVQWGVRPDFAANTFDIR